MKHLISKSKEIYTYIYIYEFLKVVNVFIQVIRNNYYHDTQAYLYHKY